MMALQPFKKTIDKGASLIRYNNKVNTYITYIS